MSTPKSKNPNLRKYILLNEKGEATKHHAFNKGPADAAQKLSKQFFKTDKQGEAVIINIMNATSDGARNSGAVYKYKIVQEFVPFDYNPKIPDEKQKGLPPKNLRKQMKDQNGKTVYYRIKRKATKLETLTPSQQKKNESKMLRKKREAENRIKKAKKVKQVDDDSYESDDDYESAGGYETDEYYSSDDDLAL